MNQVWVIESPLVMVEGEVIAFSLDWLGANVVQQPGAAVFRNGQDVSSSVMVSGDEHVLSHTVLTLKKITALPGDGGSNYVVAIQCTVDGNIEKRKLLIRVVKASSEG